MKNTVMNNLGGFLGSLFFLQGSKLPTGKKEEKESLDMGKFISTYFTMNSGR